ncbi:hypothetical protein HanRHA438_Chr06g0276191 [Helianthus annuus]|nr:hypothetical protein HanRHA438_Chr06g0276191 [Helianthus annuus]
MEFLLTICFAQCRAQCFRHRLGCDNNSHRCRLLPPPSRHPSLPQPPSLAPPHFELISLPFSFILTICFDKKKNPLSPNPLLCDFHPTGIMVKLFKVKEKQRELAENSNEKPPVISKARASCVSTKVDHYDVSFVIV